MKKTIALQGRGHIGKSTTLRRLYTDFLLKNGYKLIKYEDHGDVDFLAILEKDGELIGITSAGDNYDLLQKRVTILVEAGCTIIVCACRTREGSVYAIEEFVEFQHEFVQKTIASSEEGYENANEKDAKTLFKEVEKALEDSKLAA